VGHDYIDGIFQFWNVFPPLSFGNENGPIMIAPPWDELWLFHRQLLHFPVFAPPPPPPPPPPPDVDCASVLLLLLLVLGFGLIMPMLWLLFWVNAVVPVLLLFVLLYNDRLGETTFTNDDGEDEGG
jgi:hypothetical protein